MPMDQNEKQLNTACIQKNLETKLGKPGIRVSKKYKMCYIYPLIFQLFELVCSTNENASKKAGLLFNTKQEGKMKIVQ